MEAKVTARPSQSNRRCVQLGFMSAIVPELTLEEVFAVGKTTGYTCVELMCWPPGKADRRYAGVTHIDVSNFDGTDASPVLGLAAANGMDISGLGYYCDLLSPNLEEGEVAALHLRRVITAARMLDLTVVSTFVGRDWTPGPWTKIGLAFYLSGEIWSLTQKIRRTYRRWICPMLFTAGQVGLGAKTRRLVPQSGGACSRRSRALTSGLITIRRIWCGSRWTILPPCGNLLPHFSPSSEGRCGRSEATGSGGHPGTSPATSISRRAAWTWGRRAGQNFSVHLRIQGMTARSVWK